MRFSDHFSAVAAGYERYRPRYPDELFAWLAARAPARQLAWDCATGSGQAAAALAAHFRRVEATDASAAQIARAATVPGVSFRVAAAEESGLPDATVDLITVAQALHWFDFDRFFAEAERVLVDRGLLAAWCYELCRVDETVDALIRELYADQLGDYWPAARRHIEARYETIALPPWERLPVPGFRMEAHWGAADMLGYLSTWSAVQRCREATGRDPLSAVADRLERAWGNRRQRVVWPLHAIVCRRPARS